MKPQESTFIYISVCHNAPATKPACATVPRSLRKGKKGDKAPEFASLGHWSCSQCGRGCKVSRVRRKEEK